MVALWTASRMSSLQPAHVLSLQSVANSDKDEFQASYLTGALLPSERVVMGFMSVR